MKLLSFKIVFILLLVIVFVIRVNMLYGVRCKINVIICIMIVYIVLSIFLNSFVCFGYFCFIFIKVMLIKVVNIMIEIVDVGWVFVKLRNGFVGNSFNNLFGIVVFLIEVNFFLISFRWVDFVLFCCRLVVDILNFVFVVILIVVVIFVVRIKILIIRLLILLRFFVNCNFVNVEIIDIKISGIMIIWSNFI